MNIRPLSVRPLLGEGSFFADGAPGSTNGRLNCIPFPIVQAPTDEAWRIDVIHLNNWSERDAIYSLTIETATYGPGSAGRAAVSATTPGLRSKGSFDPNGASTIRWGKRIQAGDDHRIEGPFWLMGGEWFCGAAIPGLSGGLVNCQVVGWIFE